MRAVLEGVALNARWMQRYVERFARRRLDPIAFIGGGARSPLWCQIIADVLGRSDAAQSPTRCTPNVRGAAFLAGIALGELSADDLPAARADRGESSSPTRRARRVYDELFAAFRDIYKAEPPALRAG